MFPIFSVYRSANISEKAVNGLFKPLTIGIKLKLYLPLTFGLVAIICLILVAILYYRHRQKQNLYLKK